VGSFGWQRVANDGHFDIDIVDDLGIPETQNAIALRFDKALAGNVGGIAVLATVDLDNKALFAADEVGNERSYGDLTAEFEAVELAGAQGLPQFSLCKRGIAAKFARPMMLR
jgi:hypothetical protein